MSFFGHFIPPNVGPLTDHPFRFMHEIYIPQREGGVLEVSHRVEIRLFNSI